MKKLILIAAAAIFSMGAQAQTLLQEGFDGTSIPEGWTATSANAVGWQVGSPSALSSTYWSIPSHDGNCAAANDDALGSSGNSSNDLLKTPSLDLSGIEVCAITLDVYSNGSYGSLGSLLISNDNGETFTSVIEFPYADGWQTYTYNISGIAGSSTAMVAIKHSDQGYWADGLAIDNVHIFVPDENVVAFNAITSDKLTDENADYTVKGEIINMGSNAITSLNVDWTSDDGQTGSALIDGLNIAPFATYEFSHPDILALGTENIDLTVTITDVNESGTMEPISKEALIHPLSFIPVRKVLVEEATGTWCGWCPRGAVNLDLMADNYPQSIEVAVHNGDPMANSTYDNGIGTFISGYPSGLVDRANGEVDPSEFEENYLNRIAQRTYASVDVSTTFDAETRELTATVNGVFAGTFAGNYRLNAIVIEDNVTGTSSGYAQTNYYAGGQNGPMGGYESLPQTVPASQMIYRHVGRAILGGWSGSANSIPANPVAGETYTKVYSYTVPSSYDASEITVAAVIIDQTTGEIVNAAETDFITSTQELEAFGFDFSIYPNPANETSNIILNLQRPSNVGYAIYNINGKKVANGVMGAHGVGQYMQTLNLSDLPAGLYVVTITAGDHSISRKLSVQ